MGLIQFFSDGFNSRAYLKLLSHLKDRINKSFSRASIYFDICHNNHWALSESLLSFLSQ